MAKLTLFLATAPRTSETDLALREDVPLRAHCRRPGTTLGTLHQQIIRFEHCDGSLLRLHRHAESLGTHHSRTSCCNQESRHVVRLQIAAIVFMSVQAVMFGAGMLVILLTPIQLNAMAAIPMMITVSFVASAQSHG